MSRAKQFREITRNGASFDMDVFLDRVDQNPATYVRWRIEGRNGHIPRSARLSPNNFERKLTVR